MQERQQNKKRSQHGITYGPDLMAWVGSSTIYCNIKNQAAFFLARKSDWALLIRIHVTARSRESDLLFCISKVHLTNPVHTQWNVTPWWSRLLAVSVIILLPHSWDWDHDFLRLASERVIAENPNPSQLAIYGSGLYILFLPAWRQNVP